MWVTAGRSEEFGSVRESGAEIWWQKWERGKWSEKLEGTGTARP